MGRNEKPDDDLDLDLHLSEDDDEGIKLFFWKQKCLEYYFDGFFFIPAGSGSSSSVEQEIEHKCEMCGTEFVAATSLKIHRLKCDKQKKMACEFCLDEFRSETSLKMHKLICVKVTKNPDDN